MPCTEFWKNWPSGSSEEDLDFQISSMYFQYFIIISPFVTDVALHLEKVESQGCFVRSFVEIGLVVLEKKILKFRHCIFANS